MGSCLYSWNSGGEGSITLTRMHSKEHRRPCISISSNDKEMLIYIQSLVGGRINNKKNYDPHKYQNSYTLYIKKKEEVFQTLIEVYVFLRIERKKRAEWILNKYDAVTLRNGKYNESMPKEKSLFEKGFFKL